MSKKGKVAETKKEPASPQVFDLKFYALGALAILLIGIFISSKTQTPKPVTLKPAEITTSVPTKTPVLERYTAGNEVAWKIKQGVEFPFAFSYPETLPLVVFINDPDTVAIVWGSIPPQQNILLNIERVAAKLATQPKAEYVRNWYKSYSGLKDVAKVEPFTNTRGMKGYKAVYVNKAGQTPNLDIFFEVPRRNDLMLHFANGIIDPVIFEKIIDSVSWEPPVK